ncbi:MAG TPA: histidine phosphatase family protein [Ktedonobacterales bacterium]|nr:histidine phosphatase family protein [Ktedonobacterales bacterium]
MRILFLRHGQTATNLKAAVHKKDDQELLDDVGCWQADQLAGVCLREKVEAIYCSPEKRALQTTEIIGGVLHLQPIVIEDLRERDWGDWSGKQWVEIQSYLQPMAPDERYTFIPPNGESWQQMENRLKRTLQTVTTSKNDCIAVVTHGGALRALMPILKSQPKETSFQYEFKNASVTIFELSSGVWHDVSENDTTHLL